MTSQPGSKGVRLCDLKPVQSGGPFAREAAYNADSDPNKVNLIIGAYRDDEGQPWQLSAVREAKSRLCLENCLHEYLPLRGNADFLDAAKKVLFGHQLFQQAGESIASIQTVSGTGANSLIATFLQKHLNPGNIWLPQPTWVNHADIWKLNAPGVAQRWYPYYDENTRSLHFDAMMETLGRDAQEHDAILIHACAHNPTGLDPTKQQWDILARFCQERNLFVVIDSAYQGFASGDLDRDAWAVRHFFSSYTAHFAVCQSFSKNLGLYGERTGVLHVVGARDASTQSTRAVEGHLVNLQRASVSMAPLFGSRVTNEVLANEHLRSMWKDDLLTMSSRIRAMRQALYEELVRLQTPGSWEHIIEQTGMFSYTGLDEKQVESLQSQHHVYMLPSGRASICGLTTANVAYAASAIHQVVTESPRGQVRSLERSFI